MMTGRRCGGRRTAPASAQQAPARPMTIATRLHGTVRRRFAARSPGRRRRADPERLPAGCVSSRMSLSGAAGGRRSLRMSFSITVRRSTTWPSVPCIASTVLCVRATSCLSVSMPEVSSARKAEDCLLARRSSICTSRSAKPRSTASRCPSRASEASSRCTSVTMRSSRCPNATGSPRACCICSILSDIDCISASRRPRHAVIRLRALRRARGRSRRCDARDC